ncbi:MAG: class I SAM-dependent methyltransferase [Leadbetterella sp.]
MSIPISPLTGKNNVQKEQILDIQKVKNKYKAELNTDVSRFFENISELAVYQCRDSNLRFYFPFSVVSDGEFYAELARNYKSYYNPWKWEHEIVFEKIKPNETVLEIGCGEGSFLSKLKEKFATPVGLDLNPEAVIVGKKIGVKILNESITEHAQNFPQSYDTICAFQLFEHVNEVGDFLKNTIKCLKKGGVLAIGVPNNHSYYFKKDTYHTLNLPPHHMLLWDANSLEYIAKLFDLEIIEIIKQPVKRMHRGVIYKVWLENLLGNNLGSKLINVCTRFIIKCLPIFKNQGVTIVAIYRKR